MKNNEILITVRFELPVEPVPVELSFLILKDTTLKDLVEAIYYGLQKKANTSDNRIFESCFSLYNEYIRSRKEIQVLYTAKGKHNVIDVTGMYNDGEHKIPIYKVSVSKLGFVTSSCILITLVPEVRTSALFGENTKSYFLNNQEDLEYNISTRRLNAVASEEIDILPPGDMPNNVKNSLLDVILPTVLSTGGMLAARMLIMKLSPSSAGMGNTMLLMSGAMGITSLVTTSYTYFKKKRENKEGIQRWKENYENYIARVIRRIKDWQKSDIVYLNDMYPSIDILLRNTAKIDNMIFARSQNDNDFLRISLGYSDEVKPLFEIKAEKKDHIFYDVFYKMRKSNDGITIILPSEKKKKKVTEESEDRNAFLLTDLPYNFANKGIDPKSGRIDGFNYLRSDDRMKPPLLVDLRNCGALGVISDKEKMSLGFTQNIVFELAYYHSPQDVQFVFFFNEEPDIEKRNLIVRNYKYLPHTNELFDDVSQFVFDKESSGIVFGNLLSIMNERGRSRSSEEKDSAEDEKYPNIVCVMFNDYAIKETGFSKYLPEPPKEGEEFVNELGLVFICIKPSKDLLPKYCAEIINLDQPDKMKLSYRYNVFSREILNELSKESRRSDNKDTEQLIGYRYFDNLYIHDQEKYRERFETAYKRLSAIYYTRIAENGHVPSMVTLFELYGLTAEDVENNRLYSILIENWNDVEKNDVTRGLRVPIGKNEHGALCLDLYEKADGPHMLVAGTTGSGKSETIITYLIGLCMKYSPMDLNLMLVDMKGGGFSDRLGNLPHCVGVVTDTAGEEEGTSSAYMLKRFLETLNAEIKRRKLLLSGLGVDNADAYIRAIRVIRKIKELVKNNGSEKEIEALKKKLNEKQTAALEKDDSDIIPLSHLILVVDEFTELKRFSAESNGVDFISEITTIARVGRTLGFHIILVSQNIEGAITEDIRVNSKARICLKVATKQASKEMLGSSVAAAPTMPLNGRAYLLVGTGSRFEYFQSAYTGANRNMNIEAPVRMTYVPDSGRIDRDFYFSSKDNKVKRKSNANTSEHDTQLAYVVNTIIQMSEEERVETPMPIFLPPLPLVIPDETEWEGY